MVPSKAELVACLRCRRNLNISPSYLKWTLELNNYTIHNPFQIRWPQECEHLLWTTSLLLVDSAGVGALMKSQRIRKLGVMRRQFSIMSSLRIFTCRRNWLCRLLNASLTFIANRPCRSFTVFFKLEVLLQHILAHVGGYNRIEYHIGLYIASQQTRSSLSLWLLALGLLGDGSALLVWWR